MSASGPDHVARRSHRECRYGYGIAIVTQVPISRSSFHCAPKGETRMNRSPMRQIDERLLESPYFGVWQMTWHLKNEGHVNYTVRRGELLWIDADNIGKVATGDSRQLRFQKAISLVP